VFDLDGVLRIGKNTVANTEYLLRHLNEQLAEESGFDSCLVMSGNTKKDALKTYVVEADYVLEDVSRLNDIL